MITVHINHMPILLNPRWIVMVEPYSEGTALVRVWQGMETRDLPVDESVAAVAALLESPAPGMGLPVGLPDPDFPPDPPVDQGPKVEGIYPDRLTW